MKIKICGIVDGRSAAAVAAARADAIGFVFADSPRRLSPSEATRIAEDLPSDIQRVAVFRLATTDEVRKVLDEFPADIVQSEADAGLLATLGDRLLPVLHDDERLEQVAHGLPVGMPVLLEAAGRGGRGIRPDWTRAGRLAGLRRLVLAGGLKPANVREAILNVHPWGVDVSSGVESSPGVKSMELIREFVREVRQTEAEVT